MVVTPVVPVVVGWQFGVLLEVLRAVLLAVLRGVLLSRA
jgi:hypothetical protein